MKTLSRYVVGILFLCTLLQTWCWAGESADIAKGNRHYRKGNYDAALEQYQKALIKNPNSSSAVFNMGTAYYKKGEYDKAIDSFTKALVTPDKDIEAKAAYNIGNAKYQQGTLKENTNLAEAVKLKQEAASYYKRAIELGMDENDAKYNCEFVQRELKDLLDKLEKQKKSGSQPGEGGDQSNKEKESSQKESSQDQDAPAQAQESENETKDQHDKGDGEQENQEKELAAVRQEEKNDAEQQKASQGASLSEDNQGQLPAQTPSNAGQEDTMSEQEARMLLDSIKQDEIKGSLQDQTQHGRSGDVAKDW